MSGGAGTNLPKRAVELPLAPPAMPLWDEDLPIQSQLLLLGGKDRSFEFNTTRATAFFFFFGSVCRNHLISN